MSPRVGAAADALEEAAALVDSTEDRDTAASTGGASSRISTLDGAGVTGARADGAPAVAGWVSGTENAGAAADDEAVATWVGAAAGWPLREINAPAIPPSATRATAAATISFLLPAPLPEDSSRVGNASGCVAADVEVLLCAGLELPSPRVEPAPVEARGACTGTAGIAVTGIGSEATGVSLSVSSAARRGETCGTAGGGGGGVA